MEQELSSYRHPKHDQIAELLLNGATNLSVSQQLEVNQRAVARVRKMLGIPPTSNATSREDKLAKYSTEKDDDGHVAWKGRRATSGAPVIRHQGRDVPASHVAFQARSGRPPVGQVRAECDVPDCLNGSHVSDDLERRKIRMQLRAFLEGLPPQPWDMCPAGLHTWEEDGRLTAAPSLKPYCRTCETQRHYRWREGSEVDHEGSS